MPAVRIDDQLEEMRGYIARSDWDGLENNARKRAEKLAGKEITAKIAAVNLSAYSEQLEDAMKDVFESAEEQDAAAVYFEYDMEHNWSGTFFVCHDYMSEDEEDDDWAREGDEEMDGPESPELAEFFDSDFDSSNKERGVNGYLIARSLAVFGRCAETMPDGDFAVCIGYHDQDHVTRIRESHGHSMSGSDDDEDEEDDE
ncbi:MAG: hypothetical protein ACR2IE_14125 [Candidatus Sumerlaeaceae bacterium]